jgi:hypothetical protein
MSDIAQQIPYIDCGYDTLHPARSPENLGSFRISGALSRHRVSLPQPHPFVRRSLDRGFNMVQARSWGRGRIPRVGIGHEAFLYFLRCTPASRWRPFAQQHQCGADANRALGQPAPRTPPIAGAIP